MAARQGYVLKKSRRRDPRATDYGEYTLWFSGSPVGYREAPGEPVKPWTWTRIEDVEEWLTWDVEGIGVY